MAEPTAGHIVDGVHVLPVRVYWEDTDASGIVYHANYLRYFERGRSDLLRLAGVAQGRMLGETGVAFAVRRMRIDYQRPARLDDALEVHTRVSAIGGASVDLAQDVRRDGEAISHADVQLACIDGKGRARRLPGTVAAALSAGNATLLPSFSAKGRPSGPLNRRRATDKFEES